MDLHPILEFKTAVHLTQSQPETWPQVLYQFSDPEHTHLFRPGHLFGWLQM